MQLQEMFLHKATPPKLGEVAVAPKSQKQTQGVKGSEEAEECAPNKRARQNFRERT